VLGFLPGLFHAWYIIAVSPDPTYEQVNDEEQGNVTYYYVQGFVGPSAPTPAESSRPSTDVPPSYAQAVQGDHKVQSS
jgi:hypothetical protein